MFQEALVGLTDIEDAFYRDMELGTGGFTQCYLSSYERDECLYRFVNILNTIRAYERESKDLKKAQFDIVLMQAKARKCETADLI